MYKDHSKQRYSLRKPFSPPIKRQYLLLRLILVMVLGTGLLLFAVSPVDADTHSQDEYIYYYQQGRDAAGRIPIADALSEQQIRDAVRGFEARLKNQASPYTTEQIRQASDDFQGRRFEARLALAEQNLSAGQRYIEELERDPDYVILDQGLAYKILNRGQGEIPAANAQLRLNYQLFHLDGSELDRSNQAAWISIQGVLPGWRMALRHMPAGSRWRLVVPPHLAYGEKGAGDRIGPQQTLIFDISLLEVRN